MNSLQKPCNYYDKYIKYKTKYIEYKNKLMVVNGKKRGGGKSASIEILSSINPEIIFPIYEMTDMTIKPLYIKIMVAQELERVYKVVEQVGKGKTGTVFKIEQIIPHPLQTEPEMFVIKLSILKNETSFGFNKLEGDNIDKLTVPPRVKALFQGKTGNIDFAIFNYMGQDLETFLRYNSRTITPTKILSLITQLHKQLYDLNFNNSFHNDVKKDNICINNSGELTVIDFGSKTDNSSNIGSLHTICVVGIINYLMRKSQISQLSQLKLSQQSPTLKIEQLNELLKGIKDSCKSSDYVGFFNVIIDIICRENILWPFLSTLVFNDVISEDIMTNLLKLLYFFYYITIDKDLWNYEELIKCDMVKKIFDETYKNMNACLSFYDTRKINYEFPFRIYISKYDNLRRFLYHLYTNIKDKATEIIEEKRLPQLLFNLGCTCLQPNFNLTDFNTKFNVFFSDSIWKRPIADEPQYISEVYYQSGKDYKMESY